MHNRYINNKNEYKILEPCNRCCSDHVNCLDEQVTCVNCGHSEILSEWQLRGWRNILKNPPHFGGTIHVYGKEIGRTMANWDSKNKMCDNKKATHWLRVPDPTKQIDM
jgi:hypothetical protein